MGLRTAIAGNPRGPGLQGSARLMSVEYARPNRVRLVGGRHADREGPANWMTGPSFEDYPT
jgi:hypothetical protein